MGGGGGQEKTTQQKHPCFRFDVTVMEKEGASPGRKIPINADENKVISKKGDLVTKKNLPGELGWGETTGKGLTSGHKLYNPKPRRPSLSQRCWKEGSRSSTTMSKCKLGGWGIHVRDSFYDGRNGFERGTFVGNVFFKDKRTRRERKKKTPVERSQCMNPHQEIWGEN